MTEPHRLSLRTPTSVKLITVIEVQSARGMGTEEDMVRPVTQYYDFDGKLLFEHDPLNLKTD